MDAWKCVSAGEEEWWCVETERVGEGSRDCGLAGEVLTRFWVRGAVRLWTRGAVRLWSRGAVRLW